MRASKSQEEVQKFVTEPIQKKYPFITVEYMPPGQGVPLEMLVQTGNAPDIVFTDFVNSISGDELQAAA